MSQAYKEAGVDIAAAERTVAAMKSAVESTYSDKVLSRLGSFGGLYDLSDVCQGRSPILVASTDGVGTKVEVARVMGQWDSIGKCLVNHCVNDILVQGAHPLFFLDFIGCHRLEEEVTATIVKGMAQACRDVGAALLGGETAEMGTVYGEGGIEVAGTIVGTVEREALLTGETIQAGDLVLGLPSTGLHTNGYTLARKILKDSDWRTEELEGRVLGDHLLDIHRCYLAEIRQLREAGLTIKGLAHVTGGGIPGNFQRILPGGLGAELSLEKITAPPLFALLAERGQLTFEDQLSAFNLGVGMLIVLPAAEASRAQDILPELSLLGNIRSQPGIDVRP